MSDWLIFALSLGGTLWTYLCVLVGWSIANSAWRRTMKQMRGDWS